MAKLNEKTGNAQVTMSAKLISIAEKPLQNSNGKDYYPATIEFQDKEGKTQRTSAIVYGGNLINKETGEVRMSKGNHYLATAEKTERGVLITVSHNAGNAPRPSEDMFDFSVTSETVAKSL